ncbi:MAG: hypothetical protein PSX37_08200 [bacterium]|nr:hypothetical protein [bacterium]
MIRSVALLAMGVLLTTGLAACSSEPTAECHSNLVTGEMPAWANTGFSEGAEVPHVVGANGLIVAVPFSQPLVSTAEDSDPQNKLLLVAKVIPNGSAPMMIDAQLNGIGDVVHRVREGGPGPGTLDLPLPGCWRITMQWADQTDTVDLNYVAGPSADPIAS